MILLRKKREEKNFSQLDLSAISGVSQQTISAIESGARPNPGVETLYPISRALGCTIDDLYQKEESEAGC